ncbi:MAG: adenylate/guanylate cyclase domain-containing protein [Candidatus Velthaea sp.]
MSTSESSPLGTHQSFAPLHERARASNDHGLAEAVRAAERAYDALSLERTSLASRLAASSAQTDRELQKALTIGRVAETVNSSLELDIVLSRVLDIAIEVMNAHRCFVMIADDSGTLQLAAMHGLERAELDSDDLRPSQTTVQRVFETGEPIFTTDAQRDPRFNAQMSVRALKLRSIICVPLSIKDKRIGVVYLDSRVAPGLFTRHDPDLLTAFANQAALAIENARLFDEQRARLREIMWLEELQAKVLGSITNGVITTDENGTITTFNESAGETFGIPPGSMTGRPVGALDALIPHFSGLLAAAESSAKPMEVDAVHPTRGALRLEVRVAPIDLGDGGHGAATGLAIAVTDLTERRALETMHRTDVEQRRAIREGFNRYLAPHVVESMMKAPGTVELGGERRTATILFADIRDFTKMAARMPAERVVEILNAYFEAAVSVVFKHDGLLDKFYGDGLMAVFGPPRVHEDDAARALRAAGELHEVVRRLEPIIHEPLRISVGLSTGDVVAGHIGSTRRMDYTVIGDAVNLASRLQSAAPPSATYCDETTYLRSGLKLPGERLQAKIKGRDDLVTVYRLT